MRRAHSPYLFAVLVFSQVLAANPACADAPGETMQKVEVTGARTRLLPYADLFYPMAKAVQQALGGRAALAVQLRATRQEVRTDDLEIWLEGERDTVPVRPERSGVFVVPVVDRVAIEKGHFLINKRKEDLSVNLVLVPLLAPDGWTIGGVRSLLEDARGAVGRLLPWYQKPVVWAVTRKLSVSVCSRMRDAAVTLVDGDQVVATLAASEELRNYANETVFCRSFNGDEAYPAASRLVIPEDGEVLLM
ncbi:MAG: hypothetical protein JWQ80_3436 [Massilia sp.]|nr:hypothetical protein [Massilia sp.]